MGAAELWCRIIWVTPGGDEVTSTVDGGASPPDLAAVHALAWCLLRARRAGGCMRLRDVREDLEALLDLVGLLREMRGEVEDREDVLDVEE
jgi:hypothetical protein